MIVTLTPQAGALIRERIERGDDRSAETLIEDALVALRDQDAFDELHAKLQVGIDQADRGEVDEWTPELHARIRRDADERFQRGELPYPDVTP